MAADAAGASPFPGDSLSAMSVQAQSSAASNRPRVSMLTAERPDSKDRRYRGLISHWAAAAS